MKYIKLYESFDEHSEISNHLISNIERTLTENIDDIEYITVYRGIPKYSTNVSPNDWTWVSSDINHAKEYGEHIVEFKVPNNLHLLYTDDYSKWESLIDDYTEESMNVDMYEELKYEPNDDFIYYLMERGFDGFVNGDNILIFDSNNLLPCCE